MHLTGEETVMRISANDKKTQFVSAYIAKYPNPLKAKLL